MILPTFLSPYDLLDISLELWRVAIPSISLKVSYEGKNYRTVRVTYIGEYLYIIRLRDLAGSVISQG